MRFDMSYMKLRSLSKEEIDDIKEEAENLGIDWLRDNWGELRYQIAGNCIRNCEEIPYEIRSWLLNKKQDRREKVLGHISNPDEHYCFGRINFIHKYIKPMTRNGELVGFRFFDEVFNEPILEIRCDVSEKTEDGHYQMIMEDLRDKKATVFEIDKSATGTLLNLGEHHDFDIKTEFEHKREHYCLYCGCTESKLTDIGLCYPVDMCKNCGRILSHVFRKSRLLEGVDPMIKPSRRRKNPIEIDEESELKTIEEHLKWIEELESQYKFLNIVPYWNSFLSDLRYSDDEIQAVEEMKEQVRYHYTIGYYGETLDRLAETLEDRLNYRKKLFFEQISMWLDNGDSTTGGLLEINDWMKIYSEDIEAIFGEEWKEQLGYWDRDHSLSLLRQAAHEQLKREIFITRNGSIDSIVPVIYNGELLGFRLYNSEGEAAYEIHYHKDPAQSRVEQGLGIPDNRIEVRDMAKNRRSYGDCFVIQLDD